MPDDRRQSTSASRLLQSRLSRPDVLGKPVRSAGPRRNLSKAPASPAQLIDHRAVNLRLPTSGALNGWRLMRGGRETRVRIDGHLTLNSIDLILDAALDGPGLAYLPLDQVQPHLEAGRLMRVLSKFTPDLPGYHLYYPHRRHASAAFNLSVETIRFRE